MFKNLKADNIPPKNKEGNILLYGCHQKNSKTDFFKIKNIQSAHITEKNLFSPIYCRNKIIHNIVITGGKNEK